MQPASKPALISIQPRYVEKILSGSKVLEFRRMWAAYPVDRLVIYSSSPIQRIVAVARIEDLHRSSPTALWELAKAKGGGVTRRELYEYFNGKKSGYALELSVEIKNDRGVDPKILFENFRPPQSFHYLAQEELAKIVLALEESR